MAARPPNLTVLAEQRFANVIGEMAIAAQLPPPRVLVVERPLLNAAVFGRDEQHATIVMSQGLLARLDRAEMQGVAAHLVGSIANGDLAIGLRAAVTMSLFGLITYLGTVLVNGEGAGKKLVRIMRATLVPTAAGARKLAADLADPFVDSDAPRSPPAVKTPADGQTPQSTWEKVRPFLWLPLAGPLVMSGFFGGIVSSFGLGPLLALAWRQRKYMADATAVRLTRDPNTLGEALEKMSAAGTGAAFAPWTAHLSVVPLGRSQTSLLGGGVVPMFPSLDRRLRGLGKLGAHLTRAPRKMPLRMVLIVTPLFVIVGVLIAIVLPLLVWLSLALTMLFTALPLGALHLILRALGH
jgi:Zn-dependent protease with chaperone function